MSAVVADKGVVTGKVFTVTGETLAECNGKTDKLLKKVQGLLNDDKTT